MASTQRAYRNSEEFESEKTPSPFKRIDQVRASTLAERHRNLIVAMLHKNRFGDELWMSTESICVVMGRVCYRRKQSGWSTHEKPRQLHGCDQISRRAVQRLIDEVVSLGVLTQIYGDNELVPYGGGKKFRHTATYRLNPDKLVARKTHDEYVEQRARARARSRQKHREESEREHAQAQGDVTPIRKTPQPAETPKSPAPAAPLPVREKPAAEHRSNQRAETSVSHKLTRAERKALQSYFRGLFNKKWDEKKREALNALPAQRPVIQPPPERDPWLGVLRVLEKQINAHSFDTWLKPTRYAGESDGVLYVSIPTPEFQHAALKYADLIQSAIDESGLCFASVKFVAPAFVPPESSQLNSAEVTECVEKACKLLSTAARPIALEDGIVALRIAGLL